LSFPGDAICQSAPTSGLAQAAGELFPLEISILAEPGWLTPNGSETAMMSAIAAQLAISLSAPGPLEGATQGEGKFGEVPGGGYQPRGAVEQSAAPLYLFLGTTVLGWKHEGYPPSARGQPPWAVEYPASPEGLQAQEIWRALPPQKDDEPLTKTTSH
jgi:hypothetical protein